MFYLVWGLWLGFICGGEGLYWYYVFKACFGMFYVYGNVVGNDCVNKYYFVCSYVQNFTYVCIIKNENKMKQQNNNLLDAFFSAVLVPVTIMVLLYFFIATI